MSNVTIVIPVQEETELLDGCIKSVEKYTKDYELVIHKDPTVNVAQARQSAQEKCKTKYICFLDDDSRMIQDNWLPNLIAAIETDDKLAVAFAEEQWGDGALVQDYQQTKHVDYGPAACMLIDIEKTKGVSWNKHIGLCTGWLGGDFEEVEYTSQLREKELYCIGVHDTVFKHIDRPSIEEFRKTDRHTTCTIMKHLIKCRECSPTPDFFRKMEYVKANPNNDRMLASGKSLKDCFYGVLKDNKITHFPMWKQWGLV